MIYANCYDETAFTLAKENAERAWRNEVTCKEYEALPALMSRWMATKNWRFLRLWLRIKVMLKHWITIPLRKHQELLRLAQDDWETHHLNPNKKKKRLK
jgi:hypothetical protein